MAVSQGNIISPVLGHEIARPLYTVPSRRLVLMIHVGTGTEIFLVNNQIIPLLLLFIPSPG